MPAIHGVTACHNVVMSNPHRIHLPTLLGIILAAAIFRAVVAAPDVCISRDGVWFVEMAKKLADEPVRHMRIETKQPGFSWLILAADSIVASETPEDWQATGTIVAGVSGVAVCALVYFLALRLFDRKVAAVAGLLAAFWPHGAQLSADVLSDMPHLVLYLAAMALLAAGLGRWAWLRWSAAGVVIGAAYWFRLEAIGLLPAVIIWAFVVATRAHWRRAIAPIVLFLLAFAVAAGPFVLMARWPGGQAAASTQRVPLLSSSARVSGPHAGHCIENRVATTGRRLTPPGDSGAPSGRKLRDGNAFHGFRSTASRFSLHPWLRSCAPSERSLPARDCASGGFSASIDARRASGLVVANAVGPAKLPGKMAEEWARSGRYVFAALFLAGLFIKSTPKAARPVALLCGIAATMQLLLVAARVLKYGELSSRYMLVPIALTIPWAAAGFVHLVGLVILRSSDDSRYKFIPIWASGLMFALFPLIYYGVMPINAGRLALREAGCWLRQSASEGDVILADDQNLAQVQYYADRIYPKAAKWDRLARDAGEAARDEAIGRIRPKWFVTMIDQPNEPVDADARAAALCDALPGYAVARVFDDDARPVIVLVRSAD